jgi:carbonic anhydrase/acetyltransferase-like protein (isoleucine patch superfamily)
MGRLIVSQLKHELTAAKQMGCERGEAICFNEGKAEPGSDSTLTPFGRAFYEGQANYFVIPYLILVLINVLVAAVSASYWSISAVAAAQILRQLQIHLRPLHLFRETWYNLAILFGLISCAFMVILTIQAWIAMAWVVATKWLIIGRRKEGRYEWDKSSYCQRWQLHLTLSRPLYRGYGNGGILGALAGSAYLVWYFRALGAVIGRDCSIFPGGFCGLMTEPDLVELGDNVNLDDCSVVAHINSRGNFALNRLKIGSGCVCRCRVYFETCTDWLGDCRCALRTGSRLLSGASMEDSSMLLEHTLLSSGETAEAGSVYAGWPARRLNTNAWKDGKVVRETSRRPAPASASPLACA